MIPDQRENQLELFDPSGQSAVPPRKPLAGPLQVVLRHDQLLLVSIGTVIGLTVVFALGVERGKELVRSERAFFARQQQRSALQPPTAGAGAAPSGLAADAPIASSVKTDAAAEHTAAPVAPVTAPKAPKEPTKLAASKSRYAVQVVTYSRPHLAKREMDRLHSEGERAFLVLREGRTTVYVGPFPTKGNASQRLTALKPRYQDCFVRSL